MKKLLTAIVVITIILNSTAAMSADFSQYQHLDNVYAQMGIPHTSAHSSRDTLSLDFSFFLYDFDENPVAIFYSFMPSGYAIYDYNTAVVLEYGTGIKHPFYTDTNERYYYNGVFEYYKKTIAGFENLETGYSLSFDEAASCKVETFYNEEFYSTSNTVSRATVSEAGELTYSTRYYNCNIRTNYSYFYPNLSSTQLNSIPGVAGPLACAILLAYYDDYYGYWAGNYGDFADDYYKASGSVSNQTYGIELVKELVQFIDPAGNGSLMLDAGMREYLSENLLAGSVEMRLYAAYTQMKSAVSQNVPLIIGTSSHYCVGIGYRTVSGTQQIKVNKGWGAAYQDEESEQYINANTVVSSWELYLD